MDGLFVDIIDLDVVGKMELSVVGILPSFRLSPFRVCVIYQFLQARMFSFLEPRDCYGRYSTYLRSLMNGDTKNNMLLQVENKNKKIT